VTSESVFEPSRASIASAGPVLTMSNINTNDLARMIQGAIEQIRRQHKMLSELDSAIGDGDHGTTMLRAVNQLESVIRDHQALNPSQFLDKIAWTLLGIDGGATGPLLGTFFLGMSEAIPHAPSLTNTDLVLMFEEQESIQAISSFLGFGSRNSR